MMVFVGNGKNYMFRPIAAIIRLIWLNRVVMLGSHHDFSDFVKLSLVGCLLGQ